MNGDSCCNNERTSRGVHQADKNPQCWWQIRMGTGGALFALGLLFEYGLLPSPALPAFLPADFVVLTVCMAGWLLIGGDVLLRALKNVGRAQIFDENFLMSISTIGAFAIGEYPEAVAVMLFYQIGEAFQEAAAGKSRASISKLMDIRPDFARRLSASGDEKVSPADILLGERILVRPGERVPLDGVVEDGASALDVTALTGESLPRDIGPGDEALSGAINTTGVLTIRVTKTAGESTVAKILRLVEESTEKKSHVENFITKFARYYTPAVVFAALLLAVLPPLVSGSFEFRPWIYKALVFLVVSCPCALVISIPLSFSGGLGAASRSGVLVKGSNYLSALAHVDTVVFDKTGTLTRGIFRVRAVLPASGFSEEELLGYAAAAEAHSNHPVAAALRLSAGIAVSSTAAAEIPGHGVKAVINGKDVLAGNAKLMTREGVAFEPCKTAGTMVYTAVDGVFAGAIVIGDEIKSTAAQAVRDLRSLGVREVAMFTGDTRAQAEEAGRAAGISRIYSELLPHEKAQKLEELLREHQGAGSVVFVGDGINDAPSLAIADIGVAMGGAGSDAAIEAADIVLMTDEPEKIARGIHIARRTRRIVSQNISLALGVKAVILVLGALGLTPIWGAVFGDVGVSLIAVLNAMRALKA